MKPILFFSCLWLGLTPPAQAQPVSKVVYDFYHVRDSTNKTFTYKEEMILYAGNEASLYTSYTKMKQDSANAKKFEEAQRTGNMQINLGVLQAYTNEEVYFVPGEKKLILTRPFNYNNYAIEDDRPAISWQILRDTAVIEGYACQKATGSFRGRVYTVWFTTDLPYDAGPWKLQGLPGLILKAIDEKSEVMFLCKSVETAVPGHPSLFPPRNAIATSQKEFDRMVTAYREQQIASGADSDFRVVVTSAPSKTRRVIFNNPIELEN